MGSAAGTERPSNGCCRSAWTRKKRDEPGVAMVLAIDRSGSMTGIKIEMAKAAAKATADTLSGEDLLEVIAFDSAPTRVVRMTPAKHRARIQNDIARIQPGGRTEIFPALDAAYTELRVTRARKKHVILLTDGQAPSAGIRDSVQAMVAEGVTVSSVGLALKLTRTSFAWSPMSAADVSTKSWTRSRCLASSRERPR